MLSIRERSQKQEMTLVSYSLVFESRIAILYHLPASHHLSVVSLEKSPLGLQWFPFPSLLD